jgi:hypothetical protein
MNTRKCDLCKEAAFVPLPDYVSDQAPSGWWWVPVHSPFAGVTRMLLCPFCVAVARELQVADQALALSGLGDPPSLSGGVFPHPFIPNRDPKWDPNCWSCGKPKDYPTHHVEQTRSEQAGKPDEAKPERCPALNNYEPRRQCTQPRGHAGSHEAIDIFESSKR